MAIQPKFQIGRKQQEYTAEKRFTNREESKGIFMDTLKKISQRESSIDDFDVIMYYGVGGIGKTSLQNHLQEELLEHESDALYTQIDFKDTALHSPARALLELVREITYKERVQFPHFEIAYSIYFYKRNPDITFNEKKLPFEKELGIIANIVDSLDGMGIAGVVSGIVGKIYDSKKNWNLDKDVKSSLKDLEKATVQEIEERLVAFFAFDLEKAIQKLQIPSAVIFLDTFEALWTGISNKAIIHTKDSWVRDLIGSLPNVLFVICGREYLEWEKYESDWKRIIQYHQIYNLENKDAQSFLTHCGVEEATIRDKMIASSGGYPYHLDLSVDTYFEMKNRGETLEPSRFGSNHREILDRFLEYLSDQEIETLKITSIARFYNQEVFSYLLTEHPTGYAITKYNDFNKFSFISEETNKQFIHNLMRQGILESSSEELIRSVHKTLATYYGEKYKTEEPEKNYEKDIETLEEQIYHQKAYLSQEEFINWLAVDMLPTLKKLQLRGESRFLRDTLISLYRERGAKDLGISLMQILVDMVHLNGDYELAIAMIDELFDGLNTEEILASQASCHLYIRKIHHQMFSYPVDGLIQDLLEIEPILATKNWPKEYNELIFMLGGNLGVLSGNLAFSRKWLLKAIRYAEENKQADHYCRALRKYVDVLKLNGHVKWAKAFCKEGIQITRKYGYERYEAILVVTLADLYRMENNYAKTEELLETGLEMIKKVGIKGWIGHIHATYAEMNFQKGMYEEAVQEWKEAIAIYQSIDQKWGLIIGAIGLEQCKLDGLEIAVEGAITLDEALQSAKTLHYEREIEVVEHLLKGNTKILVLPYL